MKEKEKNLNFTEGEIRGPLMKFAVPVLFTLLLQSLYGAVDFLVVGQFSDPANVSAVATGSLVMNSITFVVADASVGITVLLGQLIGKGDREKAGKVTGAGIALFILIGIVLTVVMECATDGVAAVMHAPAEAFIQTSAYIRICSGGMVFIVAYNILGSVFRGIGNSKVPLITVLIATVFNIFGDLLLVSVFHMGAAGAAYATVASQALSVILSCFVIRKQELPLDFHAADIRLNKDLIAMILSIGIPIAIQDLLVSISFLIIMAIVNEIGVIASAGVGVAQRLCGFMILVPSSFMQSMSAFTAQNYGAGKPEREFKALRFGITASFFFGLFLCWLCFFHGKMLSSVFSNNADVISAAADYLKGYSAECLFTGILFCFIGFYNGIQRTKFVMVQGIIGAFGVRVPLSFLAAGHIPFSLVRMGLATPFSSMLQIALCLLYLIFLRKKQVFAETAA